MHSSARCRLVEISHVSFGDCFAALQIDLCVRGMDWGVCGTRRLRNSHQFLNYVISGLLDRRQSAPTSSTLPKTRQIIALPMPKSNRKSKNSNSGRFALYRLPVGRVGQVRHVGLVRQVGRMYTGNC